MWAHYLQVRTAQRPPIDAPIDWLYKEIGKIIDYDADLFLSVAEDDSYVYKVLIMKALNIGALARSGDTYKFPGANRPIGTVDQMVNYLQDDRHQEDLLKLKTQIEIAEKQTLNSEIGKVSKTILTDFATSPVTSEKGPGIILPEDVKDVKEQIGDTDDKNPESDKPDDKPPPLDIEGIE